MLAILHSTHIEETTLYDLTNEEISRLQYLARQYGCLRAIDDPVLIAEVNAILTKSKIVSSVSICDHQ